jgi:hypothetical protein
MAKKAINTEVVHYGTEPTWTEKFETDVDRDCALARAFSWYNYMSSDSECKKWTIEYMKSNKFSKEDIQAIQNMDISIKYGDIPGLYGFNVGMMCRMLSLGAPVRKEDIDSLNKCLTHLINKEKSKPKEAVETTEPVISIRERTNEKIYGVIGDLEKMADTKLETVSSGISSIAIFEQKKEEIASKKVQKKQEKTITVKDILHTKNVKPNQCDKIASWFTGVLSLFEEDMKENAYSCYSKAGIKEYKDFLNEIILSCKQYGEANKTITIRKKRKKSPVDMCKKVKYQQEDKTLGIKSLSPTKIIGAEKVLLYNTQSAKATIIEANSSHGLSIKGSTIIDFDSSISKSYTKKIRKPAEFMKEIKDKGIRAVKSSLDSIKTSSYECSGRINEDTIILGVY